MPRLDAKRRHSDGRLGCRRPDQSDSRLAGGASRRVARPGRSPGNVPEHRLDLDHMIGSLSAVDASRRVFTSAEVDEVRRLIASFPMARIAEQRTTAARLRHLGLRLGESPTAAQFNALLSAREIRVTDAGGARAAISPEPRTNAFRVAVGVKGRPVPDDWSAFDQRYQWFGSPPRHVAKGTHLFALAVDRWRSAVVGLYEAMSSGAERLPGSPDPERWPWALGVKPLAAISPPDAIRIDGFYGPQNGLPSVIPDEEILLALYNAIADSPPPPRPRTREQEIQLLEASDVVDDVLAAVPSLGKHAQRHTVIAKAIELGDWNEEELAVRAWYTGSGTGSHVQRIVVGALDQEIGRAETLVQRHGVIRLTDASIGRRFGVPYRPAGDRKHGAPAELPEHVVDMETLDRATQRHMELQDSLATELRRRGIAPRSPGSWQPEFDLAFEHEETRWVVEAKSSKPVSPQQMRLGLGQVLEYRHRLAGGDGQSVRAALLLETTPDDPWPAVCREAGVSVIAADELTGCLTACLTVAADAAPY
jgi:hypothetical protein